MLEETHASQPNEAVVVERSDIEEVVSSWTGMPVTALEEDEADRLVRMEEILRQRVVGQDEAIKRAGPRDPAQPPRRHQPAIGRSGRSSSSVRRASARPRSRASSRSFLFQDARRLVRFDMSEYMEKHTVSRLIGSPPGYVGFEEGGQLSEQVRRQPVLGDPARRDREGPPRHLQPAPSGARGRTAHRQLRQPGRLHQHPHHHDLEPRHPGLCGLRVGSVSPASGRASSRRASARWSTASSGDTSPRSSSTGSTTSSSSTPCRRRACCGLPKSCSPRPLTT